MNITEDTNTEQSYCLITRIFTVSEFYLQISEVDSSSQLVYHTLRFF